jgi:hypothetical protein
VPKRQHSPRWNPDLKEWFCSICGRTSDHTVEADARAELDGFECIVVGIHKREESADERKKTAIMKKIQKKF